MFFCMKQLHCSPFSPPYLRCFVYMFKILNLAELIRFKLYIYSSAYENCFNNWHQSSKYLASNRKIELNRGMWTNMGGL